MCENTLDICGDAHSNEIDIDRHCKLVNLIIRWADEDHGNNQRDDETTNKQGNNLEASGQF